jgi:hypothetical protein
MTYQLIVPNIIETQTSGFIGAIEREYRGRKFRVEFHGYAPTTRCTKDGAPITWEKLPHEIRKDAHAGCAILNEGYKMRRGV